MRGRIADWKDDRGFGFIEPESGGQRLFFHISGTYGAARPIVGTEVLYELSKSPDGRLRAVSVAPVAARLAQKRSNPAQIKSEGKWQQPKWLWIPAILVFPMLWWLTKVGKAPLALLWIFGGASVLTYIFYWLDKRAAESGTWRTSEQTLQMCALFCGWPGALLAQRILPHKSSKWSFQRDFWVMVVVNIIAVTILSLLVSSPFFER